MNKTSFRKKDEITILDVPFMIADMVKKQKEKQNLQKGRAFSKKMLTELRKEAKKIGWKIEGKYGKDGQYHVYAVKGTHRRIIA